MHPSHPSQCNESEERRNPKNHCKRKKNPNHENHRCVKRPCILDHDEDEDELTHGAEQRETNRDAELHCRRRHGERTTQRLGTFLFSLLPKLLAQLLARNEGRDVRVEARDAATPRRESLRKAVLDENVRLNTIEYSRKDCDDESSIEHVVTERSLNVYHEEEDCEGGSKDSERGADKDAECTHRVAHCPVHTTLGAVEGLEPYPAAKVAERP